jgi:hypothetical protein
MAGTLLIGRNIKAFMNPYLIFILILAILVAGWVIEHSFLIVSTATVLGFVGLGALLLIFMYFVACRLSK